MTDFVRICSRAELPAAGEAREMVVSGTTLCIANVYGVLAAVDNACPHRQGPLGQGTVERGKIVCPWHGWAFDLKTGVSTHSANSSVEVYKLKIEGEDVFAKIQLS